MTISRLINNLSFLKSLWSQSLVSSLFQDSTGKSTMDDISVYATVATM